MRASLFLLFITAIWVLSTTQSQSAASPSQGKSEICPDPQRNEEQGICAIIMNLQPSKLKGGDRRSLIGKADSQSLLFERTA